VLVNEQPAHLRPFIFEVPEHKRERTGRVDLYLPDCDEPRAAIVFIHGGPIPAVLQPTPRDWPLYVGYGRYAASRGVVGVTLDHRLHALADYPRAAEDVAAAVEIARADPRVDAQRVALWFFSGGALLSADWLAGAPAWLRCVAASYPVLAPLPNWAVDTRFRPATVAAGAGRPPMVLTRVGLESAEIAATVAQFLAAAEESEALLDVIDVPDGHHGFETIDHTDQTRHAVQAALESVLAHLHNS